MESYRVRHIALGKTYYVMADTPLDALEIVTLQLGDAEGHAAWEVDKHRPSFVIGQGVVFDSEGEEIKPAGF